MDELKACPFCGGKAEMICAPKFKQKPLWPTEIKQPDEYNCWVKCKRCHTVCGAVEYPTKAEAAAAWNRRAAPENKPLTCEGCVNNGCWENEVEYGYPSPCTGCKRRASDNYACKPEQEEK